MNIAILCNHSYPSVGGSEVVIQAISERLDSRHGHSVTVISGSTQEAFTHNFVNYLPANESKISDFISGAYDHIMVYSDSCTLWPSILSNIDQISATVSINLMGMYRMRTNPGLMRKFTKHIARFSVMTHSSATEDAKACDAMQIPYTCINNGVDLQTMVPSASKEEIRQRIGITTPHMILMVANFFPGKGQEYFAAIMHRLRKLRGDFSAVLVANHCNISYINHMMDRFHMTTAATGVPFHLLYDKPRQEVIDTYFAADVFAFTSQKELAPLVILESMAARLPFVSLDVGNVIDLIGGMRLPHHRKEPNGFCVFDDIIISRFANGINELLTYPDLRAGLGTIGRAFVERQCDWDNLVDRYNSICTGGVSVPSHG